MGSANVQCVAWKVACGSTMGLGPSRRSSQTSSAATCSSHHQTEIDEDVTMYLQADLMQNMKAQFSHPCGQRHSAIQIGLMTAARIPAQQAPSSPRGSCP